MTRWKKKTLFSRFERLEDRLTPAGALDTTFNPSGSTPGYQTVDFGVFVSAQATVVQPDGKIVVVGTRDNGTGVPLTGGTPDFIVARLNPNGTLDDTFGDRINRLGNTRIGQTSVWFGTSPSAGSESARAVGLYPDDGSANANKIVVVGYTNVTGVAPSTANDFAICRLNTDGSLDSSFGPVHDGKQVVAFSGDDQANAVGIQSDGKIVVVGTTSNGTPDVAACRLTTDGTLDTSFDPADSGRLQFGFGTTPAADTDVATAVKIYKPDAGANADKIVIAGYNNTNSGFNNDDIAVARLKSDGTFDVFGTGGKKVVNIPFTGERANALDLGSDGKIVVAGRRGDDTSSDVAVMRFGPDGTPDGSFGPGTGAQQGFLTLNFGSSSGGPDVAYGVAVQPDNKVVVGGKTTLGGTQLVTRFAAARLDANGTLDPNFGTGGKQNIPPQFGATPYGLALQPDGRIVLAGIDGGNFAVARLEGDRVSLSLILDDAETTVHSGQQLTYTLTVANGGPDQVNGTNLGVSTSQSLNGATASYTSQPSTGVTGNSGGTQPVTGSYPHDTLTIPVGGTVLYTITVTVPASATGTVSLFSGASVPPGEFDANTANNTATDTDTVRPTADLSATITDGTTTAAIGSKLTYTVVVANSGPDDVTGATVAGSFAPGLTGVTFTSKAEGGASGNKASGSEFPAETLTLPSQGKVTYLVSGTVAGPVGTEVAKVAVTAPATVYDPNATNNTATDTDAVVTGNGTTSPPTSPLARLVGTTDFAAGADAGGGGVVFYNPDGTSRFSATPFGSTFTDGVRTTVADFNGDGTPDLVVGTGPGVPTQVMILDGKDQHVLFSVNPFEAAFTGGVYVAAGDLNGDGVPDLVITPDQGGGPRCRVFDGKSNFSLMADFFGISDPNFRGGARAAVGDVNGDGVGDLLVAAGFQGGPRVAVFNGATLASGNPVRLFNDFFAFEQTLRNGVFISAGDLEGTGKADIIAGGGPGGGPRVTAFSAADLIASGGGTLTPVANFFAGDPNNRGGVRLAVKNLDGDTRADLVVGSGTGAGSRVTAYQGKSVSAAGTPPPALDFDAFAGFTGGVFVG
jgi:uncharacterized delta-60 repeat protein/uncharacterized repeat protein (TIGR01451 family)